MRAMKSAFSAVTLRRRDFLQLAAGAAALRTASTVARAQAYPTRPVHWIVSFTAGGPNDTVARIIGQYLSHRLGQQFVIENKVGAGGNIGMAAVLSSPPDGYTIGFVAPNNAINTTLYEKLPFDFVRDSVPVAGTMLLTNVMVVHPDVPAKTVAEFIAYAKANPGTINMASSGSGTSVHMSGELFKVMTGINMQHVPYRGSARRFAFVSLFIVSCARTGGAPPDAARSSTRSRKNPSRPPTLKQGPPQPPRSFAYSFPGWRSTVRTATAPRFIRSCDRGDTVVRSNTMCACGMTTCTAIFPFTSMSGANAGFDEPTSTIGAVIVPPGISEPTGIADSRMMSLLPGP